MSGQGSFACVPVEEKLTSPASDELPDPQTANNTTGRNHYEAKRGESPPPVTQL